MYNLEQIAADTRKKIFKIVCQNKAGHLASCLSSADLLTVLYFGGIMNYNPKDPVWEKRDRFVLSKGHSALGIYVTLSKAGFFDSEELNSFCIAGTKLGGLPCAGKIPGIEATTGSLGHGLSFAAGIALSAKIRKEDYKVYALIGDGESQEGSIWEAALFIAQHQLNNLTIIVDNNHIQATGATKDILKMDPMAEKWRAFGFDVIEIDGHKIEQIKESLTCPVQEQPKVIVANTIKGKGLSYVENQNDWHYKMPDAEQIETGIKELHMTREEFDNL